MAALPKAFRKLSSCHFAPACHPAMLPRVQWLHGEAHSACTHPGCCCTGDWCAWHAERKLRGRDQFSYNCANFAPFDVVPVSHNSQSVPLREQPPQRAEKTLIRIWQHSKKKMGEAAQQQVLDSLQDPKLREFLLKQARDNLMRN